MKRTAIIIASMLTVLTAGAQTINIHKADGTVVSYPSAEVAYIDFTEKEEPQDEAYLACPDNHHPHMIDLGLPSGTLWACCNVGANAPEEYGNYYAWGETQPKSYGAWDTYQWGASSGNVVNIGFDIAGTGYDAATANWGASWCMPSKDQIQELLDKCTSTWTTQEGVNGCKFTGSNGGGVFLPAAGDCGTQLLNIGAFGFYWSSTLYNSAPHSAYILQFKSAFVRRESYVRYYGLTVRPVRKS